MSRDETYESKRKFIFRRASRVFPTSKIEVGMPVESPEAKVKVKAKKKPDTRIKVEDTGTVRTDRFIGT